MAVTMDEYDFRTRKMIKSLADLMKDRELAVITGDKQKCESLSIEAKTLIGEMILLQDQLPNVKDNPKEVVEMLGNILLGRKP